MRISDILIIGGGADVFTSSSISRIDWIRQCITKLVYMYFQLIMGVWIAIMILVPQVV